MNLFLALLRQFSPEISHSMTLALLRMCGFWRIRPFRIKKFPSLEQKWRNKTFRNPLGIAAGFDKNAKVADVLLSCGIGHVEVGSITLMPQKGNKKPRLWRLPKEKALINRLGLNNIGAKSVMKRLKRKEIPEHLGVSISVSHHARDPVADLCQTYKMLVPYASYVTLNVSSPNVAEQRFIKSEKSLQKILNALIALRKDRHTPPLFVKMSPDVTTSRFDRQCTIAFDASVDGLIVCNTSQVFRKDYSKIPHGGLSGQPLFARSRELLQRAYIIAKRYKHAPIIIGSGGISSGENAYEMIRHGASLLQLYTGLVYQGPSLLSSILEDLAGFLKRDGYRSLQDAVGSSVLEGERPAS